jgi:hypothetical protein
VIIVWCSGTTAKGEPCKNTIRLNRNRTWYCVAHDNKAFHAMVVKYL